jgi:hypothetical protein
MSCSKSRGKGPQVIPSSLFFVIKKNGVKLDDIVLDNIKLYYFKNGNKAYISDFQRSTGEGYNLGVQTTRNIGDISADENIKGYYLEFQSGEIDTLYVNYRHLSENDAFNNPCYCYYPLEQVKYNGILASPDPTITQQKVYRFDKP